MDEKYTAAKKEADAKATASDVATTKEIQGKSTEEQTVMLAEKKGEITKAEMDAKLAKLAAMVKEKKKTEGQ